MSEYIFWRIVTYIIYCVLVFCFLVFLSDDMPPTPARFKKLELCGLIIISAVGAFFLPNTIAKMYAPVDYKYKAVVGNSVNKYENCKNKHGYKVCEADGEEVVVKDYWKIKNN